LSSYPRWRKRKQGVRATEKERKAEKERVSGRGMGSQGQASPDLGHHPQRMPNWLARRPHAKQRGTPVGVGGIPGIAL
jgi:hypothetical protein